jgi:hypothetical protein
MINFINQTIAMMDPNPTSRYPLLESLETLWTEPLTLQIQEVYLNSTALVSLIERLCPEFLDGVASGKIIPDSDL